jgi:hypothetical protein
MAFSFLVRVRYEDQPTLDQPADAGGGKGRAGELGRVPTLEPTVLLSSHQGLGSVPDADSSVEISEQPEHRAL